VFDVTGAVNRLSNDGGLSEPEVIVRPLPYQQAFGIDADIASRPWLSTVASTVDDEELLRGDRSRIVWPQPSPGMSTSLTPNDWSRYFSLVNVGSTMPSEMKTNYIIVVQKS